MSRVRRNDLSPRVEMMPVIDVVFLLLTFFIYSFFVMVDAKVMPITFSSLASGKRAKASDVQWITIDPRGDYFFNREPITWSQLEAKLINVGKQKEQPTLYVVVDAEAQTNLWPPFLKLFDRARSAGVKHLAIVGKPGTDP